MNKPKRRDASEAINYFDFLPAIALFEATGDMSALNLCIGACIETGPDETGRPISAVVCSLIGAAFVRRSLRGAGAPSEPWRNSLPLAIAIAKAYTDALADEKRRRGREKVPRADSRDKVPRTNSERAADRVRNAAPFKRLRLTRSSVLRAVTFARKNHT